MGSLFTQNTVSGLWPWLWPDLSGTANEKVLFFFFRRGFAGQPCSVHASRGVGGGGVVVSNTYKRSPGITTSDGNISQCALLVCCQMPPGDIAELPVPVDSSSHLSHKSLDAAQVTRHTLSSRTMILTLARLGWHFSLHSWLLNRDHKCALPEARIPGIIMAVSSELGLRGGTIQVGPFGLTRPLHSGIPRCYETMSGPL